ncbi:MAG: hypothetical protein WCL16_10315 [bacterium]
MQHTFVPPSTRVSRERWQEAQAWECAAWTETERRRARYAKNLIWPLLAACGLRPRFRGSDWNEWWAERFENYAFLPPVIENAVELGCGPYTNLRCVLRDHAIRYAVLSDPLIHTYVRFPLTFVRHAFRTTTCLIDDHPIEETPFASNYFDL